MNAPWVLSFSLVFPNLAIAQDSSRTSPAASADLAAEAQDEVDIFCRQTASKDRCEKARYLLASTQKLADGIRACDGSVCDFDSLSSLNKLWEKTKLSYAPVCNSSIRLEHLDSQQSCLPKSERFINTLATYLLLKDESVVAIGLKALSSDLDSLLDRARRLELTSEDERRAGEIDSLGKDGAKSLKTWQELSLETDYVVTLKGLSHVEEAQARTEINRLAARIAGLRDDLIHLQTLTKKVDTRRVRLPSQRLSAFDGEFTDIESLNLKVLDSNGSTPRPDKIFIDPKPIDNLKHMAGAAPPVPDSVSSPKYKGRLYWTRTIGDPRGRAALVHEQYPMNCAIVAQQEFLMAYKLIPSDKPKITELHLMKIAVDEGYSIPNEGSLPVYIGNLLQKFGLVIVKHVGATDEEFNASVKTGKMLLVAVDAGYLWDESNSAGLEHIVVVTGAEVNRVTGEVVGYYINDSDRNPPAAGQFIPAERFFWAMNYIGRRYIEVQ